MRAKYVEEMFKEQIGLDKNIHTEYQVDYDSILKKNLYYCAILDELGEFNHTHKDNWAWFRKNPKHPPHEERLEEYIDIVHFALSYCLALNGGEIPPLTMSNFISRDKVDFAGLTTEILDLANQNKPALRKMTAAEIPVFLKKVFSLAMIFGYSDAEILTAYFRKNQKNHERLENGI